MTSCVRWPAVSNGQLLFENNHHSSGQEENEFFPSDDGPRLTSYSRFAWRCLGLDGPSPVAWRRGCRWLCRCTCRAGRGRDCRRRDGRPDRSYRPQKTRTTKRCCAGPARRRPTFPNRLRDRCTLCWTLREEDVGFARH